MVLLIEDLHVVVHMQYNLKSSGLFCSLACYNRPIKRLQGDEKEGRSSGNSNWLTPRRPIRCDYPKSRQ